MSSNYDFCGWATRANIKCSDGKTIERNAFIENDGAKVPLVWNHQHNDPLNVLGHAILENRAEGVYAYCSFNSTESGREAKKIVQHGDVAALSIYANQLQYSRPKVVSHGVIREVSLVLAGANPGAYIESICHGEMSEDEADSAIIFADGPVELQHADEPKAAETEPNKTKKEDEKETSEMASEKTVQDVFNEFTEEQKQVVYALIGMAVEDAKNGGDDEGEGMKHNVFDYDDNNQDEFLSHAETEAIFSDAKRYGSMKDAFIAHGIENVEYLFPDDKNLDTPPSFISREMGWVKEVMGGVHHTAFSRIKSMHADITEDEARAKGYIKGKLKKDEVFSLLKRSTSPTTIYKKQKMDRDDVIDITDFDVIAWLKGEMRMMLDEEIARAILVGDGRLSSSDDKINEQNIRPIWKDDALYTVKTRVDYAKAEDASKRAKKTIQAIIRSRKNYKGSGNPTFFTTEDFLTDCLLIEDENGRVIYDTVDKLATALRVKKIVTVEVMEGLTRVGDSAKDGDTDTRSLVGIIVNLADYNVGADKGGAVNMFDDFDIDYNAQKYLIETRCSGALIKPFAAIAIEAVTEE